MKKLIIRTLIVAAVAAAAFYGYRFSRQMPQRQRELPTARVRQGDVIIRSFARGELRAVRSVTLSAPNLFGTVQVTRLAPLGSYAHEKNLIVEFDDAEVLSRLEDKQLELDQTDEQIRKNKADLAIRDNQDQVELLRARYSVRRAELEVKRNELLSAIDAKKNLLSLEEARRSLKQLESDIKSRREQARAQLAVLAEQRNKAVLELSRERMRLNQIKLLSPMSGLVAIKQNRGGFFMFGSQVPDIREGDQVQPGMPVADILDVSEMELVAKVGELDRANLHEGQDAIIQLDAIANKKFHGQIKSMSATASASVFSADPAKKFDVTFSVDMKDLLAALGAKPDQVARMMATAEQNRKKPPMQSSSGGAMFMMAAGNGGAPGAAMGGGPAGIMPGPQGPEGGPGASAARRQGGGRGDFMTRLTSQLPAADQKKVRDAMQKALGGKNMADLSPEERQKVIGQLRAQLEKLGIQPPQRGQRGQSPNGEMRMMGMGGGGQQFSAKDMANAQLPPPPEEESQLDVLLRPGLLSDIEIIVEKIPNAIHIPSQALFEREGKLVVFVKTRSGFEQRPVKLARRSESTMVIAEGLKPGEVVAMADPTARKGEKKEGQQGGGAGSPMGAVGGEKKGGR
ncbi:MAG: efflux RND transporter periplasmic adaptor subunit [Bryobacteraceae bacterium]